jgi:hypothetical protein
MTKAQFLNLLNSPWKMGLFLLYRLPGAWFMGVRMKHSDGQTATVALPYGWRSQNPFKSTYFAAQCAAGEFSTGVLCLYALQENPPMSMLVTHVEAEFFKKADQTLLFTCEEGAQVQATVAQALSTGEAHTLRMTSTGRLPNGEIASKVYITWSFKVKKR